MAKRKATNKRAVKKTVPNHNEKTMTIAEGFRQVFIANEKAKKDDEHIIKEMIKLFPNSKGKSTITRVSMQRACYNKGSAMFSALGAAKTNSYKFVDGIKKNGNKKAVVKKKVGKRIVKKRKVKRRGGSK